MTFNKYKAVRTIVDGIKFPSKREARRYGELKILERYKQIHNLRLQVRYPIIVQGIKICTYVADFVYSESGQEIVEDSKGMRTPTYRLKAKLMLACYGIKIKET